MNQSKFQLAYSFIGIIAISWWLHAQVLGSSFEESTIIPGTSLVHLNSEDLVASNYALRDDYGRYLFASPSPAALDLGIQFSSKHTANIVVRGEYPREGCSEGGHNRAQISFHQARTTQTVAVIDGAAKTLSIEVGSGEIVRLSISNPTSPSCGRARIAFLEQHTTLIATLVFIGVWLGLALLSTWLRLSPSLAIIAAGLNVWLLLGEATIGSINYIAFSGSLIFSLILFALLNIILATRLNRFLKTGVCTIVMLVFAVLPSAFLAHQALFGVPISEDSVFAVLQSYPQQAIEFWRSFVGLKHTGIAFAGCVILFWAMHRALRSSKPSLASLLVGGAILVFGLYNHKTFLTSSPSISLIDQSIKRYQKEIAEFEAISQKRHSRASSAVQNKNYKNNLSIFIIGESVNKNHMSAYGYPRLTTPHADKKIAGGELLRFTQAYSNHTHSNPTLSFMLTAANQYNSKKWISAASILNLASASGTRTTWLSNHRMLGGWSNHITVLAKEADYVQTINRKIGRGNPSTAHDESLLPLLRDSIEERPNQAVFLHFYNSHFDYCQRYPSTLDAFEGSIDSYLFGSRATDRKINNRNLNCYDSTILYTDQLLAKLWSQFETSSQPTIISYIADHADEVFDAKAHNSAIFDYEMTDIPLLIWANTAWKQQHARQWESLVSNQQKVFTNDFYFETVLGLIGINDPGIQTNADLSSDTYLAPTAPKSLHGKIALDSDNNAAFWQRTNAQAIKGMDVKLAAANIDSIGRANIALELGIKHLHLNIAPSKTDELIVLDRNYEPIGATLRKFLAELSLEKVESLIILSPDNTSSFDKSHQFLLNEISENLSVEVITSRKNFDSKMLPHLADPHFVALISEDSSETSSHLLVEFSTSYD